MIELPLLVVDVQRGGPSTGLPTKTEQADLLQAMFGRNGESPVPIVAPRSPADCFDAALEAARIAMTYRTPVIAALRRLPRQRLRAVADPGRPSLPDIDVEFATEPNAVDAKGKPVFRPYLRDPETLARPWAVPGTPGLEHRIGGIEKADGTGNISYDPANHDFMVRTRQAKVDGIADTHPAARGRRPDRRRRGAGARLGLDVRPDRRGRAGSSAPPAPASPRRTCATSTRSPPTSARCCARYERVIVPEMNLGQLAMLLRAKYLVDVESHNQVRGLPFQARPSSPTSSPTAVASVSDAPLKEAAK